ncbi:MAG: hypothetical protein ACRDJ2_04645 [Actinomycetota bacterium]
MSTLVLVEIKRLLARKLLHWLSALAVLGCIIAGTIAFFASDPPFRYEEMIWIVFSLAFPLSMLAWLVGASAIGAEWHSRGITTTLTWEPRRNRVLFAKLVAVCSVAFAWILLLQLVFSLAMLPAGAIRGTMEGVDRTWLADQTWTFLRVGAGAALAAGLGLSLATIGRNTAAAFGAGMAYLIAVEGLIRGLKPSWSEWLIGDNFALFLIGPQEVNHLDRSQLMAAALLLVYGAVVATIALVTFRKREIA